MKIIEFLKLIGVEIKNWQIAFLKRYLAIDKKAHQCVERISLKDGGKMPEVVIFDDIFNTGE